MRRKQVCDNMAGNNFYIKMIYNGAGRGAEKKAYVPEYLNQNGCKLDSDSIGKLIESAVLELKKS